MNRKTRQAIARQCTLQMARVIDCFHGQKHDIVTIELSGGRTIEVGISRGPNDTVKLRRLVRRHIEAAT